MAVESPRVRARRELEDLGLSVESAVYLADDRPPRGWDSLVTHDQLLVIKAELRAEMAEIRTEIADVRTEIAKLAGDLRSEMERGFKAQTWRLMTALIATVTLMSVILRVV